MNERERASAQGTSSEAEKQRVRAIFDRQPTGGYLRGRPLDADFGNLLLARDVRLEHAPQSRVDGRVAIGEHDHGTGPRLCTEHALKGRTIGMVEYGGDVEVLRVGEAADVGTLAFVGPRGEHVACELIHAFVPSVRIEDIAAQLRSIDAPRTKQGGSCERWGWQAGLCRCGWR